MDKIIGQKFTNLNNIPRANYQECVFKDCDLSNQNLSNYQFVECIWDCCNLSNCQMENTTLKDVVFKSSKLVGVMFEMVNPFLLKLHFEASILNFASFYKLKIPKTEFISCSIREVDFTETYLKESIFDSCDLTLSKFESTNLEKVDFSSSTGIGLNPSKNNIKKARFSRNELAGLLIDFDILISE